MEKQSAELEAQVIKMKPGTWVRIGWNDSEPSVELFLGYSNKHAWNYKGDRTMKTYAPDRALRSRQPTVVHSQVIEILEPLINPYA